jgi:hypothetical protein
MVCEGITLVLMTATPMYNSYIEIIFLLNLLLLNDKFATLRVSDIFERDGSLHPIRRAHSRESLLLLHFLHAR